MYLGGSVHVQLAVYLEVLDLEVVDWVWGVMEAEALFDGQLILMDMYRAEYNKFWQEIVD